MQKLVFYTKGNEPPFPFRTRNKRDSVLFVFSRFLCWHCCCNFEKVRLKFQPISASLTCVHIYWIRCVLNVFSFVNQYDDIKCHLTSASHKYVRIKRSLFCYFPSIHERVYRREKKTARQQQQQFNSRSGKNKSTKHSVTKNNIPRNRCTIEGSYRKIKLSLVRLLCVCVRFSSVEIVRLKCTVK